MAKNSLDNHCRHCHNLNGAFHNPAGLRLKLAPPSPSTLSLGERVKRYEYHRFKMAIYASGGISTFPIEAIFAFPFFCFSKSFILRV